MRSPRLSRWLGPLFISGLIGALGVFSAAIVGADEDAVMVGDGGSLGQVLTDVNGMTLYTWDRDDPMSATVAVNASATWPPLIVTSTPNAPAGLSGVLSTATKLDGTLQATFNGWPLYYYINDKAPGQTLGDGVGGIWHALPQSMDMMVDDSMMMAAGIMTKETDLGMVLTDGAGMTLYTWDRDTEPNVTTCYDACATRWPPHVVTGVPVAPAGVMGTFSTTMRTDGNMQSTYNGKPLYYYQSDKAAGDTLGQAVGGTWWVIDADMMMMGM